MILGVPDPVAFTLFGSEVRWYGVLIAAGMMLAMIMVYLRAKKYGIKPDSTLDVSLACIICGVIGARLYYVVFNWGYYGHSIHRILDIRGGGLAIHGGLIFGLLACLAVCRLEKMKPLSVMDLFMPAVALAQSVGRWGNYFNGEAHGGACSLPWAILVDGQLVHPTFLYESVWCLLLCVALLIVAEHQRFPGQIALLYFICYSFERFFVEGLRTDSLMLGGLKMAQILSGAVFCLGILLYIFCRSRAGETQRKENE